MLTAIQKSILAKRGIAEEQMQDFVEAKVDGLNSPKLFKGMEQAGQLIEEAISNNQKICVVGDFDADGITSTALMIMALRELGAKQVFWYINSRFEIGFGLQVASLNNIIEKYGAIDLLITVDNGIAALEAIQLAKKMGIKIIVTDHHEPNEVLPEADVIINPKVADCSYPDKNLAGVGVAFKLVQYLYDCRNMPRRALLYLDLVAVGTVADVMSLVGENRIIVKNGLKLINWHRVRCGLAAIKKVFNIKGDVSAYHLGFCFGPALNAQGRIAGTADMAVEILTTCNMQRAEYLAYKLYEINKDRQHITQCQVEQAKDKIGSEPRRFIVHYDAAIHEGIAGLIAGRVKEHYYVPTLILTKDKEEGLAKGSARSINGFNMKKHLIDECSDLLVKGGGHEMAAGVTVKIENIAALTKRLENIAENYSAEIFKPKVDIDFELEAADINLDIVDQIQELAPFGVGFASPILKMKNFVINKVSYIKDKHVKLIGKDGLEVMAFGQAEHFRKLGNVSILNPIGIPSKNEWQNKIKVQFVIKDGTL